MMVLQQQQRQVVQVLESSRADAAVRDVCLCDHSRVPWATGWDSHTVEGRPGGLGLGLEPGWVHPSLQAQYTGLTQQVINP